MSNNDATVHHARRFLFFCNIFGLSFVRFLCFICFARFHNRKRYAFRIAVRSIG